ncbi:MAG: CBS domain-containing protein [Myxococcota bacterium]
MLVKTWMSHNVITVTPRTHIAQARRLMDNHNIRQLPVVIGQRLLGLVTNRDIRDALPSIFEFASPLHRDRSTTAQRIRVEDVMSVGAVHVVPDAPLQQASFLLLTYNIEGLPVAQDGELCGIITRTDIMRAFLALHEHLDDNSELAPAPSARSNVRVLDDLIIETIELHSLDEMQEPPRREAFATGTAQEGSAQASP